MDRRDVLTGAAGSALALGLMSPTALRAADGDPYLRFVHPELRSIVTRLKAMMGEQPPLNDALLAARRKDMTRFGAPPRKDVAVERRRFRSGAASLTSPFTSSTPRAANPARRSSTPTAAAM